MDQESNIHRSRDQLGVGVRAEPRQEPTQEQRAQCLLLRGLEGQPTLGMRLCGDTCWNLNRPQDFQPLGQWF